MSDIVPLLRSPPFPWVDVSVAAVSVHGTPEPEGDLDETIRLMREARVGGAFWRPSTATSAGPLLVVRPRRKDDLAPMLAEARAARRTGEQLLCVLPPERWSREAVQTQTVEDCSFEVGEIDPWSVLRPGTRLVAASNDEWRALARIAGARDLDESPVDLAQAIFGAVFRDPFTGQITNAAQAIATLADWRRHLDANRPIAVAMGMAWWKREAIGRFLWADREGDALIFADTSERALAGAAERGAIAAWPSRIPAAMAADAARQGIPIVTVEDGFIRSVGLGADLHPPYSIVVDARGIHYDPAAPSDLETFLCTTEFTPALLTRAEALIRFIVGHGISKYGSAAPSLLRSDTGERVVLVAGQVEDDLSVKRGGGVVAGNLDLLARARALEPGATILFKPHPDVDAGHRHGRVPDSALLVHADAIVRDEVMPSLLARVDAVHVLTSLTGFEALLRGCEVVVHGSPFYAGWGLTRDLGAPLQRRGRALSLAELVAGVLILYPRYLDPVTGLPCPPEVLLNRIAQGRLPRPGWVVRARKLQGRLAKLFGTATS